MRLFLFLLLIFLSLPVLLGSVLEEAQVLGSLLLLVLLADHLRHSTHCILDSGFAFCPFLRPLLLLFLHESIVLFDCLVRSDTLLLLFEHSPLLLSFVLLDHELSLRTIPFLLLNLVLLFLIKSCLQLVDLVQLLLSVALELRLLLGKGLLQHLVTLVLRLQSFLLEQRVLAFLFIELVLRSGEDEPVHFLGFSNIFHLFLLLLFQLRVKRCLDQLLLTFEVVLGLLHLVLVQLVLVFWQFAPHVLRYGGWYGFYVIITRSATAKLQIRACFNLPWRLSGSAQLDPHVGECLSICRSRITFAVAVGNRI